MDGQVTVSNPRKIRSRLCWDAFADTKAEIERYVEDVKVTYPPAGYWTEVNGPVQGKDGRWTVYISRYMTCD